MRVQDWIILILYVVMFYAFYHLWKDFERIEKKRKEELMNKCRARR